MSLSERKRLPPGPWSVPLLGSYFFLQKMKNRREHIVLSEATRKYGNVFLLKIGFHRVVVLQGYDAIHQAFVKQFDEFSDRPSFLPGFHVPQATYRGISFSDYNDQCKQLRKFTLKGFRMLKTLEEAINAEIDAISHVFMSTHGNPVQVAPILQKAMSNVTNELLFGKRFDFDDKEFNMVLTMSNTIAKSRVGLTSSALYYPSWISRLFSEEDEEKNALRIKCVGRIREFLVAQIEHHEATFDENNIRDFVDMLISASVGDKKEIISNETIRAVSRELVGGSENTYAILDWALLFMAEHPEVQKRCQDEIDATIGDRHVQYSDRVNLKYVTATLSEVQRLANITPLTVLHCTSRDTQLMGFHIPKKTIVLANLYSSNVDSDYWSDPHAFKPDRFLDEAGDLIKHNALMPFSVGPRMCLGKPVAQMASFLTFASLLQKFSVERENKHIKHTMEMDPSNMVTSTLYPYKLRLLKR